MADTNMVTENSPDVPMSGDASAPSDNAAGLEQIKGLLKAKDDTSRFVGLALLKSVLDTQAQLREDIALVSSLWESISPKFLARLLRATKNDKTTSDEAKNMVDIAVDVLHIFAILLPEESREDQRFVGRISGLVNCLLESSPETTLSILQTMLTLVSRPAGAVELLNVADESPLIELCTQQPLALDLISAAWMNSAIADSGRTLVKNSIDSTMKSLIILFKNTDAVTLLAFVADSLTKVPSDVIPENPTWLTGLILLLRKLVVSRPTSAGRAAYTQAAAALLQAFPHQTPTLLFETKTSEEKDDDAKPFTYLFISLLLIDIRSSYPSLLPKLNSVEYPALSKRLAAAFDVISSFIGFLIRSLDDEEGEFIMPPDLLLKLRKDIAETISLTIEYLRDRYDASVAGALGLHPDARAGTSATFEGTRLTLTYDSIKDDIPHDALVLASMRTLAIWLREDENENLRGEAAGLTDLMTELYKTSTSSGLDFKFPILTALEATLTTTQGIDAFLAQEAWNVLAQDLASIVQETLRKGKQHDFAMLGTWTEHEASRGIEIVRVLLAAVDDYAVTEPPSSWMQVVPAAAGLTADKETSISPPCLELEIAIVQLATALLSKASPGLRRSYKESMAALAGLMNNLKVKCQQGQGRLDDLGEAVEDVIIELENLR